MKQLIINGIQIDVEYDYQPFEPAETGPEAQYPGCPASVDLQSVLVNGIDITTLLSPDMQLEIEQVILNGDESN